MRALHMTLPCRSAELADCTCHVSKDLQVMIKECQQEGCAMFSSCGIMIQVCVLLCMCRLQRCLFTRVSHISKRLC